MKNKNEPNFYYIDYFNTLDIINMDLKKSIKIVIENNNNVMYVMQTNVCPGRVYIIKSLLLLCTCYEIDEDYNPTTYFFVLLHNNTKKQNINNIITPILHIVQQPK
jgi:hypothetical protein